MYEMKEIICEAINLYKASLFQFCDIVQPILRMFQILSSNNFFVIYDLSVF